MKENGYVQIFKQSRNTENFECCVDEFRPLLELYQEFEHLSYNWASQQTLPEHHPAICEEFKEGDFYVRYTVGKFNKVSPDQVI